MVSEYDKKIFKLIAEAKNPVIPKMTRYQRLETFDGIKYLQFLSDFIPFVRDLRKQKNVDPYMNESSALKFYQKAKNLGLINS